MKTGLAKLTIPSISRLLLTFDRVRQLVLTQFGIPRTFIEEGEFGADPLGQLRRGDVRRALEWDHPDGATTLWHSATR